MADHNTFLSWNDEAVLPDQVLHSSTGRMPIEYEDENERQRVQTATSGDTSGNSTVVGDENTLEKVETSRSVRERHFEPIHAGDAEELHRIATNMSNNRSVRSSTRRNTNDLERTDTLAGVGLGDPVLDPAAKEFDVYKWVCLIWEVDREILTDGRELGSYAHEAHERAKRR